MSRPMELHRVSLYRGQEGFGLTLSGQRPARVGGVCRGGSAAAAGLVVGDAVVAVNDTNVVDFSHEQVVAAIGAVGSTECLNLDVAHNHFSSDDDDDDEDLNDQNTEQEKVGPQGGLSDERGQPDVAPHRTRHVIDLQDLNGDLELHLHSSSKPLMNASLLLNNDSPSFYLNYLGSIVLPRMSDSETLKRRCRRLLRQKGRCVLMAVLNESIVVSSLNMALLAEYQLKDIVHIDHLDDKAFFIATNNSNDLDEKHSASACHTFSIDHNNNLESDHNSASTSSLASVLQTLRGALKPDDVDQVMLMASPLSSASNDSGLGQVGDVRALQRGDAVNNTSINDNDQSFNTEQLERQNSAVNLRLSMQKYLRDKRQHLRRESERLLRANRQDTCDSNDDAQREADSENAEEEVILATSRSLEDLQDDQRFNNDPIGTVIKNGNMNPLMSYLHRSESNLSQLSSKTSRLQQQACNVVLKPGDQYPSEAPGVLHNRHHHQGLDGDNHRLMREGCAHSGGSTSSQSSTMRSMTKASSLQRPRSNSSSRVEDIDQPDKDTSFQSEGLDSEKCEERGVDVGRVSVWATDFDKLLKDPLGLQTFKTFLEKEFSAENINFWTACEEFKETRDADRLTAAQNILDRHLKKGANDPVNIDSNAHLLAITGLREAEERAEVVSKSLFDVAQTQIYNLMKFDSFSRFLKSDVYKEALLQDLSHTDNPGRRKQATTTMKTTTKHETLTPAAPRRKSILPWYNLTSRQSNKQKEVGKASSIASLNSEATPTEGLSEAKGASQEHGSSNLARVILPDKSTTVVQIRSNDTARSVVNRLLEKRGINYTSFDLFSSCSDRPLDLTISGVALSGLEVRLEPRVLFRLELPSKKSIGVKAKPGKIIKDVLGPILNQYGWQLHECLVTSVDSSKRSSNVNLDRTVVAIDNKRLVVTEATVTDANVKDQIERLAMPPPSEVPNTFRSLTDDLYEGLKLAQRGRLENQRGTEINFEMPDFLKQLDKENAQPSLGASRRSVLPSPALQGYSMMPHRVSSSSYQYTPLPPMPSMLPYDANLSVHHGLLPSVQEADRFFYGGTNPIDISNSAFNDSTISLGMAMSSRSRQSAEYESLSSYKSTPMLPSTPISLGPPNSLSSQPHFHYPQRREPPPLPPKPRIRGHLQPPHPPVPTREPLPHGTGYSVSFV